LGYEPRPDYLLAYKPYFIDKKSKKIMDPNFDPPKPAKQEDLKKLIIPKKKKLKKGQKAWN